MDRRFKEMLEEAESVRGTCKISGNSRPYNAYMLEVLRYGERHGFLKDEPTEESLYFEAESAAGLLELGYNERIGSVFSLPAEERSQIVNRAREKASANIRLARELGLLPETDIGGEERKE